MNDLIASLPIPTARYKGLKAQFEIYRAKDLHRSSWNSPVLKKIVLEARNSYSRYGDRPLLDSYDAKAAIYLVRARYTSKNMKGELNEWLSIRIVPGDGKPFGVGEPEIYQHKGRSVDYWIGKKMATNNIWKQVASSSRMCGIGAYSLQKNGAITFLEGVGHKYTGICFALIHKQFLVDYPLKKFPYRHITAIIRPDFYKKGLGHTFSNKKTLYPTFLPAYKFLSVPQREVQVKRDIYSYQFPTYWLNQQKLLKLLNDLRKKNKKPALDTIQPDVLVKLLSKSDRPVTIADVLMVPSKMKTMIDKFVPDVPELKITNADRWYGGMEKLIKAGKLEKIS